VVRLVNEAVWHYPGLNEIRRGSGVAGNTRREGVTNPFIKGIAKPYWVATKSKEVLIPEKYSKGKARGRKGSQNQEQTSHAETMKKAIDLSREGGKQFRRCRVSKQSHSSKKGRNARRRCNR